MAAAAFREHIGARIRELRALQGMSLLALETFSGIAQTALGNIEAGRVNIRASTAVRIADAIGLHPHELYLPTERSGIQPRSDAAEDEHA